MASGRVCSACKQGSLRARLTYHHPIPKRYWWHFGDEWAEVKEVLCQPCHTKLEEVIHVFELKDRTAKRRQVLPGDFYLMIYDWFVDWGHRAKVAKVVKLMKSRVLPPKSLAPLRVHLPMRVFEGLYLIYRRFKAEVKFAFEIIARPNDIIFRWRAEVR